MIPAVRQIASVLAPLLFGCAAGAAWAALERLL